MVECEACGDEVPRHETRRKKHECNPRMVALFTEVKELRCENEQLRADHNKRHSQIAAVPPSKIKEENVADESSQV